MGGGGSAGVALLACLAVGGCGQQDTAATGGHGEVPGASAGPRDPGAKKPARRVLEARSSSGAQVQLVAPCFLLAGSHDVAVRVAADVDPLAITADLVYAPQRLRAETGIPARVREGRIILSLDMSVDGPWLLHIHLDEGGEDTAEFLLDVLPSPDSHGIPCLTLVREPEVIPPSKRGSGRQRRCPGAGLSPAPGPQPVALERAAWPATRESPVPG